jgi:transposase InsO family protein
MDLNRCQIGFDTLQDELLDGELFLHIDEMKYVVQRWRMDYNHYRPHSSLGYQTPAGFAEQCRKAGCIKPQTPVDNGVPATSHEH